MNASIDKDNANAQQNANAYIEQYVNTHIHDCILQVGSANIPKFLHIMYAPIIVHMVTNIAQKLSDFFILFLFVSILFLRV